MPRKARAHSRRSARRCGKEDRQQATGISRDAARCGLLSDWGKDTDTNRPVMKKKVTLVMLAALILACFQLADAQQPKKVSRIGYLSSFHPASESARSEGIRLALRELGYIEGQNITIEYRYAEGKRERLSEDATELV